MDFTTTDVKRLYGPIFFEVQEEEEAQDTISSKDKVDISVFTQGSLVDWKLKSASSIALVIHEREFSNKTLTTFLKQAMIEAGIPLEKVGFGVISGNEKQYDFSEMPLSLAVVFHDFDTDIKESVQVNGKDLFLLASLEAISKDHSYIEYLTSTLNKVKFLADL